MHFDLVDRVVDLAPERIVTVKNITLAEEYLQDHFATFPVLPGVMMLECLVQAGRRLIEARFPASASDRPLVLGRVRALKYGRFVRPGATLRVEVTLLKVLEDGGFDLRGEGVVLEPSGGEPQTAVTGRLTLRPARLEAQVVNGASAD